MQNTKKILQSSFYKLKQIKISGVSIPLYFVMMMILSVTVALKKLPLNMLGLTLLLVLFGHLFYYIGNKLPIFKSYLGGGSVFTIFISAGLATSGIVPTDVVHATKTFLNTNGLLDFYIAALIVGSILGMNRKLLLKAAIRFIPVSLATMIIGFFAVGFMGMLLGVGFGHSVMFVSLPIGASINYGQLLVEYLYQDWRYPIWPLNMILILRR